MRGAAFQRSRAWFADCSFRFFLCSLCVLRWDPFWFGLRRLVYHLWFHQAASERKFVEFVQFVASFSGVNSFARRLDISPLFRRKLPIV